jgi:pimeloyl-ACP methyl ester carboxylesterase
MGPLQRATAGGKFGRCGARPAPEVFTPSLTGLGERSHLATPEVGLETHIQDVVNVLFYEDLNDVILVGHSYGGMVVTGAADRVSERISKLVYLDAFVPSDGQSIRDLERSSGAEPEAFAPEPVGWLIPPITVYRSVQSESDEGAWLAARRSQQPRKTFEDGIRLTGAVDTLPRTFIYCRQSAPGDMFGQFARRARSEAGWTYLELDANHAALGTAPEEVSTMLLGIATPD